MSSSESHSPSHDEHGRTRQPDEGPSGEGQASLTTGSSAGEGSSSRDSRRGQDVHPSCETQVGNAPAILLHPSMDAWRYGSAVQPPGGDERSVESEPRNSAEGNESSTPSVTLRPHDRTTDDSGSSVWFPHSPPSRRRLSAETEITEASPSESGSGHEEEGAPSVVSIDTAVPEPESGGEARRASRKRRQLWDHLRRGGENLRKRLCCCFSPSMTDQEEATSEGDGFRIGGGNLQTEGGILRSDVEMDSATSRHVQQVIDQHGGFAILAGDRLADYERRMHEMLETYFDRRSGLEILRLWRLDAARSMPLRVEMLPSSAPGQRILTLGDVRLLSSPRDPMDRRDDSLFRYFMSYEGLSQRMLIPGRA